MSSSDHEIDERFAVTRDYVASRGAIPLDAHAFEFETQLRRFAKLVPVDPGTRLFEIGPGTGWMLVLAAMQGLHCGGLEHNPNLAAVARRRARDAGVVIDVEVGDVEREQIAAQAWDIVVANSVLEHARDHRRVIANAFGALRPGGLFYFNSTNKFALRSGEYPPIRLYGWLPYEVRKRIRIARQGQGVVTSAEMDFHQFTHPGLRRVLIEAGFSRVLDIYEFLDVEDLNNRTRPRALAMRAYKAFPPLRHAITTFASGTSFYCVK